MLAQELQDGFDPCELSLRWRVDIRTAVLLQIATMIFRGDPRTRAILGFRPLVSIISGHRSPEQQRELCRSLEAGRPCADPDTSTHTSCPATGVDLRMEGANPEAWELLGQIWTQLGGRWGGTFGDPNHFDLGPRQSR